MSESHDITGISAEPKALSGTTKAILAIALTACLIGAGIALSLLTGSSTRQVQKQASALADGEVSAPVKPSQLKAAVTKLNQPVIWTGLPTEDFQLRYSQTKVDGSTIFSIYYLNAQAAKDFTKDSPTFSALVSSSLVKNKKLSDLRKSLPSDAQVIKLSNGLTVYVPPKSVKKAAIFFVVGFSNSSVAQVKYPGSVSRKRLLKDARRVRYL